MSFCGQCGKQLVGAKKFCFYCGSPAIHSNNECINMEEKQSFDREEEKNYQTKLDSLLRIITDEPAKDTLYFKEYSVQISSLIVNSIPQFTIGIYGEWGTGKTTLMQMIKDQIDKNYSNNETLWIKTVWFDAWRYEKEEYSAMIPLLRTIILSLKDTQNRIMDDKRIRILWDLEKKAVKILEA